ncbi:uncharacterized protein B0J16DRAFT_397862 [Fusarium flagelliforme]|uniref:uncharacterized protein n=1 Tax=Fusarium flagelliforme TaxID=2675880 RepID=UPI001E8DBFB2|nr:uncharacterized protein B0J16DRAFT_397862 [Fusarium flagelliforme]KAH7184555.1 hypothetical protein B0J16DRAFT_397862 [Fusarium flagelliforme]
MSLDKGPFERNLRACVARYSENRHHCQRVPPYDRLPTIGPQSIGPHIDYKGLSSAPRLCGVMRNHEIVHTIREDPSWQFKPRGCRLRIGLVEQETADDGDGDDDNEDDGAEEDDWVTWEHRTIAGKTRKRADLTSVDPVVCLDDNGVGTTYMLSLGLLIKTLPDGHVVQVTVEENTKRTRVQMPPTWHRDNFVTLANVLVLIAIALERIDFLGVHQEMEQVLEQANSTIQNQLLRSVAAMTNDTELQIVAPVLPFLPLDQLCGDGGSLSLEQLQRLVARTTPYYAVAPRDSFHRGSCGCLFPGGRDATSGGSEVPEAKIIPPRFYDAHRRNETNLTDKIVTMSSNGPPNSYVALSYPWSQYGPDDLDKIIATAHRVLKHRYFWVDRWCIDQDSYEDKEREVPKMKDYYSNAECTLVLPGAAFPIEFVQEKSVGAKVQLYNADLTQKVKEIWEKCEWKQRCWTLQETIMSKECIFWSGHDEAPFIDCSQLIGILYSSPFANQYVNALPYLPVDVGYIAKTSLVGKSLSISDSTNESIYQRSIVRCSSHGTMLDADACMRPLAFLLDKLRGREATLELDEYYSVFSMTSDQLPVVDYKIDIPTLLERMVNCGALGANILLTSTDQGCMESATNSSWMPRRCINREHSLMGAEISALQPSISHDVMIIEGYSVIIRNENDSRDRFSVGAQLDMVYFFYPDGGCNGAPADWRHSRSTSGLILLSTEEQSPGVHCLVDAGVLDNLTMDQYSRNSHIGKGQVLYLV